MRTLREVFESNKRTQILRLNSTMGQFIERLPIDEAIQKYGNCIYSCGYSESFTEISVWIIYTTK